MERDNKQVFYFHFRWKSFWTVRVLLGCPSSFSLDQENSTIISVDGFTGVMRLPTIRATCLLLFSNLRIVASVNFVSCSGLSFSVEWSDNPMHLKVALCQSLVVVGALCFASQIVSDHAVMRMSLIASDATTLKNTCTLLSSLFCCDDFIWPTTLCQSTYSTNLSAFLATIILLLWIGEVIGPNLDMALIVPIRSLRAL
ncbi:hypothetical protein VNO80_10875 [Phaseolus coccineus]|uniref:Uncharacterized protein n=1 Tax=Phaseolus coccineus TaxID=3886 RepID=A0AAN9NE98_PHACN